MSSTSDLKQASTAAAQLVELPALVPHIATGPALLGGHASLFDGVKVALSVVVGQVHTTLGELMALKESATLKVDRLVDMPVDVVVNGTVVARGQLVVVEDNFGVRITEVAQPGRP
jgi:flagellar motor switch protein FliN/FliY